MQFEWVDGHVILEAGRRVSGISGIVGTDLLEQFAVTFLMPVQLILA